MASMTINVLNFFYIFESHFFSFKRPTKMWAYFSITNSIYSCIVIVIVKKQKVFGTCCCPSQALLYNIRCNSFLHRVIHRGICL